MNQIRAGDTTAGLHQIYNKHNLNGCSGADRPRRGLEASAAPTRLQTIISGFSSTNDASNVNDGIDDSLSPRTAVSAHLQRLDLQNAMEITPAEQVVSGLKNEHGETPETPEVAGGQTVNEAPEPSPSSIAISETTQEDQDDALAATKHDLHQAVFEFKAGGRGSPAAAGPTTSFDSQADSFLSRPSPSKRARLEIDETPQSSPTRSTGGRRLSPSPQPQRSVLAIAQPAPQAVRPQSPSARKLPSHRKRPSDSTDDTDPPDPNLWWQASEITGYDASDPEEDNRGVNGVGYQKTAAEAWRIGQMRKKAIAEWRSREAREARAARAGGRRREVDKGGKVGRKTASQVGRIGWDQDGKGDGDGGETKGVRFEVE